jgi:hypothetical protein
MTEPLRRLSWLCERVEKLILLITLLSNGTWVAKWIGRRTPHQMPPTPFDLITAPCRITVLLPPPTSFSLSSFLAACVTHPTSFFCILVIFSSPLRQPFVGTLFYATFWWHLNVFISVFYQLSFVFPFSITLYNSPYYSHWYLMVPSQLPHSPLLYTETSHKPEGRN